MFGSIISNLFGGGNGPKTGGVGGIDDLKAGLQDQSNELLVGMGPTREARQTMVSDFTKALAASAAGTGPSLAEAQMRQAQDRSLGQQLAAARSNRAVNPALAFRQTQKLTADSNQKIAEQAGIARMQEQQQARNQFANFIGQQHQMSAQARTGALGGAQAAANIDAANQARGDRLFGTFINMAGAGGMSGATQGKYNGGLIKGYAEGGVIPVDPATAQKQFAKPANSFSQALKGLNGPGRILDVAGGESYGYAPLTDLEMPVSQKPDESQTMAGGPMDEMGSGVQTPSERLMGRVPEMQANQGAMVPGRPVVSGDSPKNDVVPAMLSPGELVVPRTVVSKGPEAISKFAKQTLKAEAKKPSSFESVLAAQSRMEERMKEIEKMFGKKV